MALTTTINAGVNAFLTGSSDLGPQTSPQFLSLAKQLVSGTLAGQADLVWGDTNTLTASSTTDIDLSGTLTSALGGAVVFARVKLIMLVAAAGNTNNVVLGGAASAQFLGPFGAATHTAAAQPGDGLLFTATGATAWPVTATTADLLRVANSGAGSSVTYSILLIGASA